jgi:sortase (surface protein transpeptidase)
MAPVSEIVGPTSREVVTLITCGGTFDSGSRNYSDRLVVRAERI